MLYLLFNTGYGWRWSDKIERTTDSRDELDENDD